MNARSRHSNPIDIAASFPVFICCLSFAVSTWSLQFVTRPLFTGWSKRNQPWLLKREPILRLQRTLATNRLNTTTIPVERKPRKAVMLRCKVTPSQKTQKRPDHLHLPVRQDGARMLRMAAWKPGWLSLATGVLPFAVLAGSTVCGSHISKTYLYVSG